MTNHSGEPGPDSSCAFESEFDRYCGCDCESESVCPFSHAVHRRSPLQSPTLHRLGQRYHHV